MESDDLKTKDLPSLTMLYTREVGTKLNIKQNRRDIHFG